MNGKTKRRVGIGALTGLVIAGVIGVNSMNVSGQVVPVAGPYPSAPYGTLTVGLTNRGGSLTLELEDGTLITQAIKTTNPCAKIILDPIFVGEEEYEDETATLLDFASLTGAAVSSLAPGGTVQIPSTLLGVESGTNCGTPSGQLGPNEALKLSLGSFFDTAALADVSVVSGTLAIGKTHSQDKELQVAYDKSTYTPGDFTNAPNIPVGGATVTSGPFDESITLRSTATSNSRGLSLKDGTVFNLGAAGDFEAAVFCGEAVPQPSTGQTASFAQFVRGAPLDKQTVPCSDVGATLEIIDGGACASAQGSDRPGCVFFNNESIGVDGSTQAVSGTLTIEWAPVPQDKLHWLNREIDYDAAGTVLGFVPVVWCANDAADVPTSQGTDFNVTTPPGVSWCLLSDVRSLGSDGKIHQTQVYYGQGDPYNR